MKKPLIIILIITCCCIIFVGCTGKDNTGAMTNVNENSGSTVTITSQTPLPQKHTIQLTLNNYYTYLETSLVAYPAAIPQKVEFTANGCLTYAYYENVIFEIEHDGQKLFVVCNAAGNGNGSYGGRNLGTITAISGTVIYWM